MSQRYRDKRERYVMLRFWLLNYPHGRACRQRHAPSTSRWSSEQRPNRHDARDAAKLIGVSKDNGAPNEPVEAR
jgi:hypothetical protein